MYEKHLAAAVIRQLEWQLIVDSRQYEIRMCLANDRTICDRCRLISRCRFGCHE